MIQVQLGDITLEIREEAFLPLLVKGVEEANKNNDPFMKTMRTGLRNIFFRPFLGHLHDKMKKEGVPEEALPKCPKEEDPIVYGVRYLGALMLTRAVMTEWEAEYLVKENGNVELVGIKARDRSGTGGSVAALGSEGDGQDDHGQSSAAAAPQALPEPARVRIGHEG